MIHHSATVSCFYIDKQHGSKSPWIIVDKIIKQHQQGQALLLQEELVDLRMQLNEMSVGKFICQHLEGFFNSIEEAIKSTGEIKGGGMDAV